MFESLGLFLVGAQAGQQRVRSVEDALAFLCAPMLSSFFQAARIYSAKKMLRRMTSRFVNLG
jgi:hypothetical protein